MFIAHLPSGYILSVTVLERIRTAPATAFAVVLAGMLGALAPDLDLLYFYLVDHRQTLHHKYISHWPLAWIALLAVAIVWRSLATRSTTALLFLVFCLGAVLHVVLDSFVGDVWWFAPFVDQPYAFFTVPARFKPWWLNFIFHWSFAVELLICVWALLIYRRRSTGTKKPPAS